MTSTTAARLTWGPASDAVDVTAYVVRRNDVAVATLPGSTTSWDDGGLSPGRTYRWTVEAVDAAGNRSARSAPATATTPMPLRSTKQLLAGLRTAPEHRAGWTSRRFPGWTAPDVDGCLTPSKVFLAEAVVGPRVRAGCDLRGGKWRSPYDGEVRTTVSRLTADHLVGLREAWESGGYRWSLRTRRQHANDLGYPSTLIAVTDGVRHRQGREGAAGLVAAEGLPLLLPGPVGGSEVALAAHRRPDRATLPQVQAVVVRLAERPTPEPRLGERALRRGPCRSALS